METTHVILGLEPLTLAEAKLFLRVEASVTTDDALITALITAARQQAERFCNASFVAQSITYKDSIDVEEWRYDHKVYLPYPVHSTVTTVKMDTVLVDYTKGGTAKIMLDILGYNQTSLTVDPELEVVYTCAGICPEGVKAAIRNILREMYDNRSDQPLSENAMVMLLPFKYY